MKLSKINLVFVSVFILLSGTIKAQIAKSQLQLNTITTAVPFLLIAPDSRAGGMGDVGVATPADAASIHWNSAKLLTAKPKMGVSVSYAPWLRALVNDINLAYLAGYYKLDNQNVISTSLRYFSLGSITFTDEQGESKGDYNPHEFAIDASWARLLSNSFSMGITGRYIYSNLTLGQYVQGQESKPGWSIAADLSVFYQKDIRIDGLEKANIAFGAVISNIGSKISYTETTTRDFIPTQLRFGPAFSMDIDKHNSFVFGVDFSKLLVPTPPVWARDSMGSGYLFDPAGNRMIESGKDPNVSVVSGMLQSFYDAPGGMSEELREINFGIGAEYWYDKQFCIRAGYFHEDNTKGDRKFVTFGAGLKYSVFGLDFAYLVPIRQRNPLENTLRFTLVFDFEAFAGTQSFSY